MGITLRCQKTRHSLDMGAGGFCRFRNKVAELASPEFGAHYGTLTEGLRIYDSQARAAFYDEFDKKTMELLESRKVSVKVADFCLQSDVDGRIRYGACKEILKAIGDYDDDLCYGYAGREDCTMFRDLKLLLQECVDNKCDLIWD